MILGTGVDIIAVERIKHAMERHGSHFLDHVFTRLEQERAPGGEGRYAYFAGRWAAKEAVAKALGTGIGADCAWTEVEISANHLGKPGAALSGTAANTLKKLQIRTIHISISHERAYACASAIAES